MRTVSNKTEKRILEVVLPAGTAGTWQNPTNKKLRIWVKMCGGGGAGFRGSSTYSLAYAGGGGGGGFDGILVLNANESLSYSVGIAGVGAATDALGTNGGDTTLNCSDGNIICEGGRAATQSALSIGTGGKCGIVSGGNFTTLPTESNSGGYGGSVGSASHSSSGNVSSSLSFVRCAKYHYSQLFSVINKQQGGASIFGLSTYDSNANGTVYGVGGNASNAISLQPNAGAGVIVIRYEA